MGRVWGPKRPAVIFLWIAITISFRQPATENVNCHRRIRFLSPSSAWAFLDATMPACTKSSNSKESRFGSWESSIPM